jgi:hypothetical protein
MARGREGSSCKVRYATLRSRLFPELERRLHFLSPHKLRKAPERRRITYAAADVTSIFVSREKGNGSYLCDDFRLCFHLLPTAPLACD